MSIGAKCGAGETKTDKRAGIHSTVLQEKRIRFRPGSRSSPPLVNGVASICQRLEGCDPPMILTASSGDETVTVVSSVLPQQRNEPYSRGVGRRRKRKEPRKKRSGHADTPPRRRWGSLAVPKFSRRPGISWTLNGGSWRRSRLIIRLITLEEIPLVMGWGHLYPPIQDNDRGSTWEGS